MRLMVSVVFVLVCLGASSAIAAEEKLPTDVAKFVAKREGCDHFRGEMPDPPDKQRMREVNQEIRKLCTGTDKKLAQLKRKYANNPVVMQRLSEFEEKIE
ncbi:hypothetical protein LK542_03505 [Massilia sp. IC2-477]|uniref:hypothetical protein n=1 Tax=Massilia sp. IC2-477 TaxID=2887198 RepID=UPI001D12C805|nr:hypothetical protein [Massilia sp. IC2-477]MCC2954680.1 hypothetical protein [Massilia sp. IC2-477]